MTEETIITIMGHVDNVLLAVGIYYSLASIEHYMDAYFTNYKASPQVLACVSGCLANTISDGVGFLVTGNFTWMTLTIVGCLIGMVIIPIMKKIKAR